MISSKRKKGESFESFLRRHNLRVMKSRALKLFREKRFKTPKINKSRKKKMALFGRKIHKNREYLKKIGKYKEDNRY